MTQTIQDIIAGKPERFAVEAHQSLRDVLQYMRTNGADAVAVRSGDGVAGVFSSQDILRRVVLQDLEPSTVAVAEVMSTPVFWIATDERYEVAKAMMVAKEVRQLVVLDKNRVFQGFVTSKQLLEADLEASRQLVSKLNDSYYEPRFEPLRRS